jgi:hypothetical protein
MWRIDTSREENSENKKGGELFTHGDGDDRQWRLFNFISNQIFLTSTAISSLAKEGKLSDARVGGMTLARGETGSVGDLTYGRQLEVRRHRRNRPYTYPN